MVYEDERSWDRKNGRSEGQDWSKGTKRDSRKGKNWTIKTSESEGPKRLEVDGPTSYSERSKRLKVDSQILSILMQDVVIELNIWKEISNFQK